MASIPKLSFNSKVPQSMSNDGMPNNQQASALVDNKHEVQINLAQQWGDVSAPLSQVTSFEDLELPPEILKGVYAMNFQKPSKIQASALPLLMKPPFQNFIGQSQSGTGKTAAFVLSVLSRIDPSKQSVQAIILSPTRELANQNLWALQKLAQFTKIRSTQALKGSGSRRTVLTDHVIVGTPGTIQDMLNRKSILAHDVRIFVVDEADVMLDKQGMGDQTVRIKRFLPKDCQMVLFSATFREDVRQFAQRVVPNANQISLKREELSVDAIKQLYLDCSESEDRYQILCMVYGLCNIGQSIIFCHKRETAEQICRRMEQDGHQITVIHGGLEPSERDRIFNSFKSGETKVLITTNVMARGIDVLDTNLVINYDIPVDTAGRPDFETYLHRIGRTGRFGRKGISINFVYDQKSRALNEEIEKYFGRPIQRIETGDIVTLEKQLKEALKV